MGSDVRLWKAANPLTSGKILTLGFWVPVALGRFVPCYGVRGALDRGVAASSAWTFYHAAPARGRGRVREGWSASVELDSSVYLLGARVEPG